MMFETVLSIAALVCLIVIVLGCLDCLFKKKRFEAFGIRDTTHAQHNAAFSVDIFDADNISDQVIIEPLPDILSKVSAVPVLRPRISCTERGKQEATLSLLSVQRSFPRNHLTYLNEIGSGWFGKAIESEAVQIVAGKYTSHVVVKMLKDDASKLEQKHFMEEVLAFRCLEHANLISLVGQCMETTPYLVILEFAAHGNLKSYLVQHRQDVDTLIATNRLVSFALDAASGLACLHRHDYIHNDLAARNCLVMSDYTLKIGDYGISDHLFKDEYYNTGTELLPVRWMAPETLIQTDGIWTSQYCNKSSDIWSFGILLWEICSLGERPYDSLTDESVLQSVVLDRQVLPSDVNTKLPFKIKMWSVMIQCWETPSERLDVEQAHHILEQLKAQLDTMAVHSDFDQKWIHLEPNQGKRTTTSLKNRSPLASSFATDFSSTQQHKPTLIYDEFETPDSTTRGDVIIDIDSSIRNASVGLDLSAPEIYVQPIHSAADHSLAMIQQSENLHASQYQIMVENELTRVSIPVNHVNPDESFEQQIGATTVPVSQGPNSTSQIFSPYSSPSLEYVTISDTHITSGNQEDTVKELSSSDADFSVDSEITSFHTLTDETLKDSLSQCENNIVNNNNVVTKYISPSQGEDEEFSDYVHTSPVAPDVDSTDFESAATTDSDSLIISKHTLEGDLCNNEVSLLRTDGASAAGANDADNIFSEFISSADGMTSTDNNRNAHADFPAYISSSQSVDINSIYVTFNSAPSTSLYGAIRQSLASADLKFTSESDLSGTYSGPETQMNNGSNNNFFSATDSVTDSPVLQTSEGLDIPNETSSDTVQVSLEEVTSEKVESDRDQNIFSLEQIEPDSTSTLLSSISDSSDLTDSLNLGTAHEVLQSEQVNSLTDFQEEVGTPSKNESNSTESGIHSHSLTESPTNHASNYSEVDSSMYLSDSPAYSKNALLSDSNDAVIQEDGNEQDTWPLTFQSNLYRCNSIDLTEDTQNAAEESGKNFRSAGSHDICREGSQSPVDSDTESSNSGSGQEYICVGQDSSGQPLTSSPDTAITKQESASHSAETSSPVDFDEYALQIASEIYLSRGLKSPRIFEIPPLETIPEHPPMPNIQEDSNYTPSDTSSMEVRYEDMFGSDSYEWDDFYGESLIGRDISLQLIPHHHNSSVREYDVSDWSMDIDSESIASGTSMHSTQSEDASFNISAQSELHLSSQTDISVDSGNMIHPSSDSESVASSFVKSTDSSKETLVSSLLSHLQSPAVSSLSSVAQNNFYSFTEKYDLETDSSSDGFTSPTAAITPAAESLYTFTHFTSPLSFSSTSPIISLSLAGFEMSGQNYDLVSPVSLDPSLSSSKLHTTEEPEISSEKSNLTFDPVSSLIIVDLNSDLITAAPISAASAENTENGEQHGAEDFTPELDMLDSDIALPNNSTCTDKQDVFIDSQENNRDTDVASAEVADNYIVDL